MKILGIDPGATGGMVLMNGDVIECHPMPTENKEISFRAVKRALEALRPEHIFLERAVSFGMGTKGAFNYGRGFAFVEAAIQLLELRVTYVEPGKWSKVIHAGIDSNLKPKAKSLMAVKRLFPKVVIPASKTGKLHEGFVDALLIAEYGRLSLGAKPESVSVNDF